MLSFKQKKKEIQLWVRESPWDDSQDPQAAFKRLAAQLRQQLNLPENADLEYKPHQVRRSCGCGCAAHADALVCGRLRRCAVEHHEP